jgi:hypothetical protein
MGGRTDGLERDGIVPEMGRVQPRMTGRSLPVPPLIPSVALIGLLFGLVLGFSMGSAVQSLTAPRPTDTAMAMATPAPLPTASPPSGGVPLQSALVSLHTAGWDIGSQTVSARVLPGAQVRPDGPASQMPDWVWVFTWQTTCVAFGPGPITDPNATPAIEPTPPACLEAAVLDYWTGEYIFTYEPAPGW